MHAHSFRLTTYESHIIFWNSIGTPQFGGEADV